MYVCVGRWRRYYHLRHHQYAGQVVDVEERLIGLGMKWCVAGSRCVCLFA